MKYRKLTIEELEGFDKEFIDFLAVNTITADDWIKIKNEDIVRMDQLIEQFSDSIFETIFRNANYLEYRSAKELYAYQCLRDKIVMVGIIVSKESALDFSKKDILDQLELTSEKDINVFTTEKKYTTNRELELFNMTTKGCEISDGKLFKSLCLAL